MKRVFIGHRGVGKTSLLKRHQEYYPDVPHFDLDAEIEKQTGISVQQHFENASETEFRQVEVKIYESIREKNTEYVIALGAGFNVNQIALDDEVVFVTRITDADGRLFLNRPRLNPETTALDESKKRYVERQSLYLARADQIYDLPEGLEDPNDTEKSILTGHFKISDAYYTLSNNEIEKIESLQKHFDHFELRTDLISVARIQELVAKYSHIHWLVSIRTNDSIHFSNPVQIDCDVDFKFLSDAKPQIYSSHDKNIVDGIRKLAEYSGAHLKLCPLTESFDELRMGFEWQQEDPVNRSFLPRSDQGRWIWYRQLGKYWQKINFIRNFSSLLDQPSVYEWLGLPAQKPYAWAAVLGKPVYFSRTPVLHQSYFKAKESFVTRIDLSADDFKNHIQWLNQLGLVYAAVTSPLKEVAYELSTELSPEAKQLRSANTLIIQNEKITGHNTDLAGFQFLMKDFLPTQQDQIAVWGGGGTLSMMKQVLPQAHFYSSQTGHLRDSNAVKPAFVESLIWAAPRSTETQFPPDALQIKEVIDLNYTENSMGLEFAVKNKIKYKSGLEMFKQQAVGQQEYWSKK